MQREKEPSNLMFRHAASSFKHARHSTVAGPEAEIRRLRGLARLDGDHSETINYWSACLGYGFASAR